MILFLSSCELTNDSHKNRRIHGRKRGVLRILFASVRGRVLSAEFEFRLAVFLQPLVPNPKTSSDCLTATILNFPPEI